MKKIHVGLALGTILFAATPGANAWLKVGGVFCDANNNGILEPDTDLPVPGVLVVVTNTSGTYSNANWTTPEGIFVVQLPDSPDTFGDFIHPLTLPPGTTQVLPAFSRFATTATVTDATNSFLIRNTNCITEPPVISGGCWLTGGGTIGGGQGQPAFSFGGVVNPGCSPTAAGGGNWNVVWHAGKLHFKGLQIEVVDCGNLAGTVPGSTSPQTPFNYIDFQGVGTLKGIAGRKANFGTVTFTARAVDLGEPGRNDRLYLRVQNGSGQTLLLISGNPGNPADVAPITISTGNLQLHVSGCDE